MKADTKSRHRNSAGGNVFIDLGFAPKEAKRLLAHAAAAEVLHVTRTRVSDVVNHKVEKFRIDALVGMLARIGKQVRLAVH